CWSSHRSSGTARMRGTPCRRRPWSSSSTSSPQANSKPLSARKGLGFRSEIQPFSRTQRCVRRVGRGVEPGQEPYRGGVSHNETAPPSPEREVLTWESFGAAARELAQQVVDSGFEPEVVVAIARGGLLPGGAVAY